MLTVPLAAIVSSNFQSDKYPGFEVAMLTSISPKSIVTKRDIDGRDVGDAWVHKKDTPIIRFTSSLNSDNLASTRSTSQLFSCSRQAWERYTRLHNILYWQQQWAFYSLQWVNFLMVFWIYIVQRWWKGEIQLFKCVKEFSIL